MKKLKYTVGFLLIANALAGTPNDTPWHLLVEPSFMHYEVEWPINGSKATVLVPARLVDGEVQPMTSAEARKSHITQEGITSETPAEASKVLATLKPEIIRGDNQVIEYIVLQSESPLTASAVLAPEFVDKFTETLGPDILVAIPNRHRVFVFPKLAQNYKGLADFIVGEYESSPNPVSKEVFQVRGGKLIAIGSYR